MKLLVSCDINDFNYIMHWFESFATIDPWISLLIIYCVIFLSFIMLLSFIMCLSFIILLPFLSFIVFF